MKIALVKPDHLGDLILSAPAIRAVQSRYRDATLLVSTRNISLAHFLFGDAEVRPLDLRHLSKGGGDRFDTLDFTGFDLVIFLRFDHVLNPDNTHILCKDYRFFTPSHEHHQTVLDYSIVSPIVGSYDIDAAFHGRQAITIQEKAARPSAAVGICVSAGFYTNCWPVACWIDLGRELQASGRRVSVICGPSEITQAEIICRALGLGERDIIRGGDDYRAFLARAADLDCVVASDGGTAHLCSLVAPLVSIFGASPFRRYAPYGKWNRLLTLELPCSPCYQYADRVVNGCLSTECIVSITPAQVVDVLNSTSGQTDPSFVEIGKGCRLYFGTSHLGRTDAGLL